MHQLDLGSSLNYTLRDALYQRLLSSYHQEHLDAMWAFRVHFFELNENPLRDSLWEALGLSLNNSLRAHTRNQREQ